ncbi:CK1 family protein kinase [Trichomonas vaginalis G3]|uniref:non-specific serine/threonine protein kinase n=1 Tax=Trichomonas vaginalis (strain ATCC PRA-98 / G3) TaxID=412133 RepID=A2DTG1_TRIV3|nr:STKc CK1 domain-containing protein [Trichomonas vaginalis G3]EAY16270.1 CK1 family protein kinase [Trichomonas vaginalis G3]KAI5523420.1 STKc CK1 domain-containing protein [Trichomonas vaginalis G3]|eukprot:XP_001328493.1 CK1 family protein kinase [Trichomonas vaginalis G3]
MKVAKDHLWAGRFSLGEKIGAGGFGQIYEAEDTRQHIKVALKIEPNDVKNSPLEIESKMYGVFTNNNYVPKMYFYGSDSDKNLLAIDLLDKSLEKHLADCKRKMSLKTVLMLIDQMITCVQYIHSCDFIHRDIKPENFMTGCGEFSKRIYIIDFGLCKRYRNQYNHQHIPYTEGNSLTGTPRYASINALAGGKQSRRDDMESLGYVWIYLLKGELPWMDEKSEDVNVKFAKVLKKKQSTKIEDLCKGLPIEFTRYFEMIKSLQFHQEPEYDQYRQMFRTLFDSEGFERDYIYDWSNVESEQAEAKQNGTAGYRRTKRARKVVQVEELLAMKSNAKVEEDKTPTEDSKGGFILGRGHREKVEAQKQAAAQSAEESAPKQKIVRKRTMTRGVSSPMMAPTPGIDTKAKMTMEMNYFKPPPPPPPKIASRI